jgi:hypothetical protein
MIDREHISAGLTHRLAGDTSRGDSRAPPPVSWLAPAALLPGRSLHVALAIWCAAERQRTHEVTLPNIDTCSFGLSRNAKYRALRCLETAGLISVQRKMGRAPIVTVIQDGRTRGVGK